MLYRAFAYQIQPLHTRLEDMQPEVLVFFEARDAEVAPATLLRLCALAWGCTTADVDYYNLIDERALLAERAEEAPGDAALWSTGWYCGPTFHRSDRTLMFVRPNTATRLLQARQATLPLRALQRAAAKAEHERLAEEQRQRMGFMGGLQRMLRRGASSAAA